MINKSNNACWSLLLACRSILYDSFCSSKWRLCDCVVNRLPVMDWLGHLAGASCCAGNRPSALPRRWINWMRRGSKRNCCRLQIPRRAYRVCQCGRCITKHNTRRSSVYGLKYSKWVCIVPEIITIVQHWESLLAFLSVKLDRKCLILTVVFLLDRDLKLIRRDLGIRLHGN